MIKEAFWKGFSKGLRNLPKHVQEDLAKQHVQEGLGFFSTPIAAMSAKMVGKRKTVKAIKALQRPGLDIDTTLGHYADKVMSKSPVGKRLFKHTEKIDISKKVKGAPKVLEEYDRPSITAPLVKATDVAKPIVFGFAMDKAIRKSRERHGNKHSQNSRAETASAQ